METRSVAPKVPTRRSGHQEVTGLLPVERNSAPTLDGHKTYSPAATKAFTRDPPETQVQVVCLEWFTRDTWMTSAAMVFSKGGLPLSFAPSFQMRSTVDPLRWKPDFRSVFERRHSKHLAALFLLAFGGSSFSPNRFDSLCGTKMRFRMCPNRTNGTT